MGDDADREPCPVCHGDPPLGTTCPGCGVFALVLDDCDAGTPSASAAHGYLSSKGWKHTTDYDGAKLYSHGGGVGHEIEVHPGGNWKHTAPGAARPGRDEQGREFLYPAGRVSTGGSHAASLKAHLQGGALVPGTEEYEPEKAPRHPREPGA